MKTMKIFIAAFIALPMCFSCSSEENSVPKENNTLTFSASVNDFTRVTMNESGGKFGLLWDSGDEIAVMEAHQLTSFPFVSVSSPQTYTTTSAGLPVATFTPKTSGYSVPSSLTSYFSYYPAENYFDDISYDFEYATTTPLVKFKILLDNTQYIGDFSGREKNKFAMAGMAAVPSGISIGTPGVLSFKNICAVLRLNLTVDASLDGVAFIDSALVESAGEPLSGPVTATVGTDGVVRSVTAAGPYTYGGRVYSNGDMILIHINHGSSRLSSTTPTSYDIVVPPKTYSAGFKVKVGLVSLSPFKIKWLEYKSKTEITFAPGTIYQVNMTGLSF